MTGKPRQLPSTALLAGAAALAALLTACGNGGNGPSASPAPGTETATAASTPPARTPAAGEPSASGGVESSAAGVGGVAGGRCHTSELRASLGGNDPGAGQENFPVVLTNTSSRSCTVAGYPGAAFTDTTGRQLGPDPARTPGRATPVTLAPGRSAWSGLSFTNPGVSGAESAKPAWLLVTPPDERDSLRVAWTGGAVPVSGTASRASLTVLAPGTGA
ncbi:hypothetical protein C3492_04980 [Streptomyces sp. Ru62]|uniref:DUF4232 domain-containing protein n=1 Tax=Streptomyces sp. Ru62 TaxID=2080745 RepID=UPI000CDDC9D7|nr:DUF4232 domain-containing protein [Streptomyces sp. Ru62]POX64400.1 hypothetical protein C3492_04980 [Streptomyces sp. Ru62]